MFIKNGISLRKLNLKSKLISFILPILVPTIVISYSSLVISCRPSTKKEETVKVDTVKKEPEIVYDRKFNDMARYFGGIAPEEGSYLDSLSKRPEFKTHQAAITPAWKLKDSVLLRPLSKWTQEMHSKEIASDATVLYPFSGPDFVTIHTLFPDAKDYVMFGLEIEGNVPEVEKIPQARLPFNMANLTNSVMDNLRDSFFYTLDMSSDLVSSDLKGTTPIILLMMARMNREVLDVKPIKIKADGIVDYKSEKDSIKMMADDTLATGMEIKFRKSKDAPVQTLKYFCLNASDGFLSKTQSVQKYIRSLAPAIAYVKSASYLMHRSDFSVFRSLLLEVAGSITQDDTGIAYRYYDKNQWNFSYFGKYTYPIAIFRSYFQPDLNQAFMTAGPSVKPLNFDMGYKSTTNLIIARKSNTAGNTSGTSTTQSQNTTKSTSTVN